MIKRITALIFALMILMSVSACNIDKDNTLSPSAATASTTVKETRIHNGFKDQLPEFKFKNEISEIYDEGLSYIVSVECTEKECEKYIKELKNAGFVNEAIEAEHYYTAVNADNYFVELTYVEEMLTLYMKKV